MQIPRYRKRRSINSHQPMSQSDPIMIFCSLVSDRLSDLHCLAGLPGSRYFSTSSSRQEQILTVGSFVMSSRNVGNHRSFSDHVKHPRTQHSSISCWKCSSQYQPWGLWQECHCYYILAAEHYKISQLLGTNRIARALGHTHATDQLGVVRFTPKIPLS